MNVAREWLLAGKLNPIVADYLSVTAPYYGIHVKNNNKYTGIWVGRHKDIVESWRNMPWKDMVRHL